MPLGLTWDRINYSCAYDSLFTVFYHLWSEGELNHRAYFKNRTNHLQTLHSEFNLLYSKQCTFESVQDHLRNILNKHKPLSYQFGKNYTDIDKLIREFTQKKKYGISQLQCLQCKLMIQKPYSYLQDYTTGEHYILKGIIYYNENHFTARIIDKNLSI